MPLYQPPLANVLTLGARDLSRLADFYRRLEWPVVFEEAEYVAFELSGIVLALFPVGRLAADGRGAPEHSQGGIRFTLAVLLDRPEEVDALTDRFRRAGGRVTKEPTDAEFFVGRSAYAADPEGNYWEILWAPDDNPIVAAARRAAQSQPARRHMEAPTTTSQRHNGITKPP